MTAPANYSAITCAISGLTFKCEGISNLLIPESAGYFHPVFASSHNQRYQLYSRHCKGQLTSTESYLLFLSILHASGNVEWFTCATCNPTSSTTVRLVESNIAQLIDAIEKSAAIKHPHFHQPSYRVTDNNADLLTIPNYIEELHANIDEFFYGYADAKTRNDLQVVENKLTKLVLAGEPEEKCAVVVADWADRVAEFPPEHADTYKRIIRSCYNATKMFNTPLALIKEVKEYCDCNIEAGSIHFHTLSTILEKGIVNHNSFLGEECLQPLETLSLTPAASAPTTGKVITSRLSKPEEANSIAVAEVIANAPTTLPLIEDYPSTGAFLQAKLAYRVANAAAKRMKDK